ncbi:ATP-dependent metallopeptidase FtsH/Yme1/Tma family protein [Helicobacter sp.]|uniref:ATP-dependent metallopeptidase FtsH/Yme1/Tma family protein n=1 Tax=Helicobacter sp. TaxID=218 RepID=UPI0025869FEB|nr:ATP-dependent metallopeptidase FtsH/Yme1/Tma family protein [Helicobacter sp.]MCI7765599.1 ATP-dependent metallopeptidase FtsH/Yme1/Tma family protein [Helicobacter sp.]
MQKFKTLYFGIFTLIFAIVIFSIFVLKDNAILISTTHLDKILQDSLPTQAKIKGDYLYFNLDGKNYKIAKDTIDLRSLGQTIPLEITQENSILENFALFLLALLLMLVILFFLTKPKKNPQNNSQKDSDYQKQARAIASEAFLLHNIKPITSHLGFEDVAGISEAKEELKEIVDYLRFPKKYQDFGVKLPKGVLLVGPPGVGKTLIAKALAGEAKVPFYYQSGASFVQIYVGMGAKRVHDLFTKAKLNAPAIIFIDEIDAVGKARGGMRNEERETTLNQLLTEMDGFEDSSGIIVIGATNNIESMDEALLRSGRFDRRIFIELPNLQERIKILKVHTRDKNCDFNYEEVAKLCVGFSGAALASLVNEAALFAIKRNSNIIQKEDILNVRDKVIVGIRKKLSYDEKEKEILAYYQAAKAFSVYWFEIPFEKITLMSNTLKYLDKELLSKNELENQIKIHLSGIAALELLYNESYSYAKDDLNEAKKLAHKMVESYGMGELLLGSEKDMVRILEDCKNDRLSFFKNYKYLLEKIQKELLTKEKLEYHEIRDLIHAEL